MISPSDYPKLWKHNVHVTAEGLVLTLDEMHTRHLRNCVKFFAPFDVSALKSEIRRRENLAIFDAMPQVHDYFQSLQHIDLINPLT